MAEPKRSRFGISTADKFLDLPRHILEFATTEKHNKSEVRSGCGLLKKWGKERTMSKILAISQHAMQL